MIALRAFLTSLLTVALLATGIGAGVARGAMAADGQICSVAGPAPVVIAHDGLPLFDAGGEPVTLDRAPCLDCLTAAADLPPRAGSVTAAAALATALLLPSVSDWSPAQAAPGGQARAPPVAA